MLFLPEIASLNIPSASLNQLVSFLLVVAYSLPLTHRKDLFWIHYDFCFHQQSSFSGREEEISKSEARRLASLIIILFTKFAYHLIATITILKSSSCSGDVLVNTAFFKTLCKHKILLK